MGADGEQVGSVSELEEAFKEQKNQKKLMLYLFKLTGISG